MSVIIKFRRGNSSEWISNGSTILASGEPGFELDTGRFKIGDGITAWSGLYYASIVPTGFIAGSGIDIDLGTNGSYATISVTGGTNISNYGDNRLLTSDGTITGINGENNLTFNGSLLSVNGSGNFVSGLFVNGTRVSVTGHTHVVNDITNFASGVADEISTSLVEGSGIDLYYDNIADTLTISVTGVSIVGHTHTSSQITDFNSAVSGLLPVKNIVGGTGIYVTSTTGNYTVGISGNVLISGLNADLLDSQHGSYYLDWTNTTNKPSPIITGVLTGDVAGTGSVTLSQLSNGTLTINSTIQPNSVALGTDTTGNYVSLVAVSGTGLSISGSAGEGSTFTVISNATPANSGGTIISRDNNGNFYATTGNLDVLYFNTNIEPTLLQGQMAWNNTQGTVDVALTSTAIIELGEHQMYRIRNTTSNTLYRGQPVYASGVHPNGLITPDLYIADGSIDEIRFIGLMYETVNNNNNGYAIAFGHMYNIDTRGNVASDIAVGDETWADGDILYPHPTVAGKLTKVPPKHYIPIALILEAANNGKLYVRRDLGAGELDDLHDINVSGVTDGQFLQYNSSTDYWVASSSGNFTTLLVNGTGVSVSGHTHTASSITDFNEAVDDRIGSGLFVSGTGINLNYNDGSNSFTVSVTGLISNPSGNRILTSRDNTTTGIDAESNLTFDGNLLNVTGSGLFSSNLSLSNQTADTVAGFDSNKNISSLSTTTYPSLTELSYVKGVTSSIQTQINAKQNTLTNPVTGTGVANHIAYWNSSSGIVADSGQLFWDATNNRLGLGTSSPTYGLHLVGSGYINGFLDVDNLRLDANTISSTNSNGNIIVSPTGTGKVGVRTASPTHTLHVNGSGYVSSGLRIDGLLGVGKESDYPLDVQGCGRFSAGSVGNVTIGDDCLGGEAGVSIVRNALDHCIGYIFGADDSYRYGGTYGSEYLVMSSGGLVGIGTSSPSYNLDVVGTGNFSQNLLVNGTGVSISGHTHVVNDITDFSTGVADEVSTTVVAGTGINLNYDSGTDTLTVSVSGLIDNPTDNRILTSRDSTTTGIDAESNLTFDGNLLNVIGSGSFSSNLQINNQTASTIASFDSNKNITSLSTATYPSLTELSYVKGVTSAIQTQLNAKAATSHTHTTTDITNFNSSVSGLLPTIANSGDNRVLTSTGTSTGINGESNLTFNGTTLNITGSATATGEVTGSMLISSNSSGSEGGEIRLAKPASGSTLNGTTINIDVFNNLLRIFEGGSPNRGYYLDVSHGLSGAGTSLRNKTLTYFTPLDNQPPASGFATLDTRNSIAVLDFDDTTSESGLFVGILPENATLASGLNVRIHWAATTATSGTCRWGVQFEKMTSDMDVDSFDSTVAESGSATNATAGIPTVTQILCTGLDSLAAGDLFRILVYRDSADTVNDTMSGDAELIAVELRSVI